MPWPRWPSRAIAPGATRTAATAKVSAAKLRNVFERFIRGSETPVAGLRLTVSGGGCSGLQYGMRLETEKADDDWSFDIDGVTILVDPITHPMIDSVNIDFIDTLTHTGFRFDNPSASAQCSCGQSFSV